MPEGSEEGCVQDELGNPPSRGFELTTSVRKKKTECARVFLSIIRVQNFFSAVAKSTNDKSNRVVYSDC